MIWSVVALVVGAALVVGFGLSMLAAHDSEKRGVRRLQPVQTMLAAEARARPPFACMKTHGDSPGAEVSLSSRDEEREAACLYRRRLLTGGQLSTLSRELHAAAETGLATWFPASAQISASRTVLGLWAAFIAAELCGVLWLVRRFGGVDRTREA